MTSSIVEGMLRAVHARITPNDGGKVATYIPELGDQLLEGAGRARALDVTTSLHQQDLLRGLSENEIAGITTVTEKRTWAKGDVLFDAGDPADSLLFLLKGEVTVDVKTASGDRLRVNTMAAGTAFGEMSIMDGGVRSSRVVADCEVTCAVLSREALERMATKPPRVAAVLYRSLAQALARRLQFATAQIRELSV